MTPLRLRFLPFLLLVAAACAEDRVPTAPPQIADLTPGTPQVVSAGAQTATYFRVLMPDTAQGLHVTLTGGTGDADLYLRWGDIPRQNAIDCFSASFGGDEDCYVDDPQDGEWYVAVVGYTAFTDIAVTATLTNRPTATDLVDGVAVPGLAGPEGSTRRYALNVPAGATALTVQTTGGTGNVNLAVSFDRGAAFYASCESTNNGNTESCLIENPTEGLWYVLLSGFIDYADATLTATVTVPPPAVTAR